MTTLNFVELRLEVKDHNEYGKLSEMAYGIQAEAYGLESWYAGLNYSF